MDSDVCGNDCEYSCFSYTTATSFAKYGYDPLSMLIENGVLIHHVQGFFSAIKILSKDYSAEENYRIIQSACLSVVVSLLFYPIVMNGKRNSYL